jgi:hypothetical protein
MSNRKKDTYTINIVHFENGIRAINGHDTIPEELGLLEIVKGRRFAIHKIYKKPIIFKKSWE